MEELSFDTPWFEDERAFAAQLARGRRTEYRVAMRLLPLGLWIKVGKLQPRNGPASRDPELRDQTDIEVEGGHRLEVKGRDLAFTSPEDFPFETVFLSTPARWERRTVFPCATVIFSERADALFIVPTFTSGDWSLERYVDSTRHIDEQTFAAPKNCFRDENELIAHLSKKCPWS